MEQTANYGLNQWDAGDRILMEDFNADNAKVDQALGILTEQAAQIANCGNCSISSFVYTGTGTCGQGCSNYCVSSCRNSSTSSANRLSGTYVSV